MKQGLTNRQLEVLDFIECYIEANHTSPSFVECSQFISASSNRGAECHLVALERKGYIQRFPGKSQIKVLRNCQGKHVELRFREAA